MLFFNKRMRIDKYDKEIKKNEKQPKKCSRLKELQSYVIFLRVG